MAHVSSLLIDLQDNPSGAVSALMQLISRLVDRHLALRQQQLSEGAQLRGELAALQGMAGRLQQDNDMLRTMQGQQATQVRVLPKGGGGGQPHAAWVAVEDNAAASSAGGAALLLVLQPLLSTATTTRFDPPPPQPACPPLRCQLRTPVPPPHPTPPHPTSAPLPRRPADQAAPGHGAAALRQAAAANGEALGVLQEGHRRQDAGGARRPGGMPRQRFQACWHYCRRRRVGTPRQPCQACWHCRCFFWTDGSRPGGPRLAVMSAAARAACGPDPPRPAAADGCRR